MEFILCLSKLSAVMVKQRSIIDTMFKLEKRQIGHKFLFLTDEKMQEERSRQLVHLWVAAITESEVFDRFHVPAVWHISYLAIEPHIRKLGMARFLLSQQSRIATKLGFAAVTIQCSCEGTARMLDKVKNCKDYSSLSN